MLVRPARAFATGIVAMSWRLAGSLAELVGRSEKAGSCWLQCRLVLPAHGGVLLQRRRAQVAQLDHRAPHHLPAVEAVASTQVVLRGPQERVGGII